MNKHQIRCLRSAILNDRNKYYHDRFSLPFLRKSILEIEISNKKINVKKQVNHLYRLWKKENVYDLYSVEYNHTSQTLYLITKNDKIIYWKTSSIFAPASAAWHLLTEVYHGYRDTMAIYEWRSAVDFDCADMLLIELKRKHWNNPSMSSLHSEYQKEKFKETGLLFIDKRIITQKEADIYASKETYHV